ncbi:hypothetical protein Pelo_4863 [Pelomyxa schiedti]|nr:hypothetical protein Pelo_4863 [Pelomyxa schiedti]
MFTNNEIQIKVEDAVGQIAQLPVTIVHLQIHFSTTDANEQNSITFAIAGFLMQPSLLPILVLTNRGQTTLILDSAKNLYENKNSDKLPSKKDLAKDVAGYLARVLERKEQSGTLQINVQSLVGVLPMDQHSEPQRIVSVRDEELQRKTAKKQKRKALSKKTKALVVEHTQTTTTTQTTCPSSTSRGTKWHRKHGPPKNDPPVVYHSSPRNFVTTYIVQFLLRSQVNGALEVIKLCKGIVSIDLALIMLKRTGNLSAPNILCHTTPTNCAFSSTTITVLKTNSPCWQILLEKQYDFDEYCNGHTRNYLLLLGFAVLCVCFSHYQSIHTAPVPVLEFGATYV